MKNVFFVASVTCGGAHTCQVRYLLDPGVKRCERQLHGTEEVVSCWWIGKIIASHFRWTTYILSRSASFYGCVCVYLLYVLDMHHSALKNMQQQRLNGARQCKPRKSIVVAQWKRPHSVVCFFFFPPLQQLSPAEDTTPALLWNFKAVRLKALSKM